MVESFFAELVISHPDLPLTPTLREVPTATVEVEPQPVSPTDGDAPALFFSFREGDRRSFESALESDRTVDDWRVAMEFSDRRIYLVRLGSAAKFTVPEITALGVRVLSVRNAEREWRLRLQAPNRESLGAYWRHCREEDVQFSLEKLYSTGPRSKAAANHGIEARLTDRQREVARTVTEMGYFDPEGADAKAVADELGISPSTLSTHLRRIERTVFRYLFGDGR